MSGADAVIADARCVAGNGERRSAVLRERERDGFRDHGSGRGISRLDMAAAVVGRLDLAAAIARRHRLRSCSFASVRFARR
jgi:hypothetical protein